ncbi:MAG: DUF1178 family protein [Proteobacteria bacterium]|nr:DUF1178 family protein [Pseudomonadota bacterium]
MIRYRLACPKRHEFEAWFPSSDACDRQIAKKLVACPSCGSTKVAKTLMAPSVVTSEAKAKSRRRSRDVAPVADAVPAAAPPATEATAPVPDPAAVLTGPQREVLLQLKKLRDKVLANAEYVGPRFAEEARKIHYEEEKSRGIYGEASPAEVEELANEGIEVLPIPVLPDDKN